MSVPRLNRNFVRANNRDQALYQTEDHPSTRAPVQWEHEKTRQDVQALHSPPNRGSPPNSSRGIWCSTSCRRIYIYVHGHGVLGRLIAMPSFFIASCYPRHGNVVVVTPLTASWRLSSPSTSLLFILRTNQNKKDTTLIAAIIYDA